MKIAICDDEAVQQQLLQKYLEEWVQLNGEVLETELFSSGESFFAWDDDRDFDLLILDIEMGQLNGMELARKIRSQDEDIPIFFVTGYEKYMAQGYEVAETIYRKMRGWRHDYHNHIQSLKAYMSLKQYDEARPLSGRSGERPVYGRYCIKDRKYSSGCNIEQQAYADTGKTN